jgi:hypothetical protein
LIVTLNRPLPDSNFFKIGSWINDPQYPTGGLEIIEDNWQIDESTLVDMIAELFGFSGYNCVRGNGPIIACEEDSVSVQ